MLCFPFSHTSWSTACVWLLLYQSLPPTVSLFFHTHSDRDNSCNSQTYTNLCSALHVSHPFCMDVAYFWISFHAVNQSVVHMVIPSLVESQLWLLLIQLLLDANSDVTAFALCLLLLQWYTVGMKWEHELRICCWVIAADSVSMFCLWFCLLVIFWCASLYVFPFPSLKTWADEKSSESSNWIVFAVCRTQDVLQAPSKPFNIIRITNMNNGLGAAVAPYFQLLTHSSSFSHFSFRNSLTGLKKGIGTNWQSYVSGTLVITLTLREASETSNNNIW